MKYTLAPWRLKKEKHSYEKIIIAEDGRAIAEVLESDIPKKVWRNAHLIAAAPDLLGALKRLVERIDFNGGLGEYKGGPSFVLKNAREAIAKAENSE